MAGTYLYGLAMGQETLRDFSRLLLAMEIRSTKKYWHMTVRVRKCQPFGDRGTLMTLSMYVCM